MNNEINVKIRPYKLDCPYREFGNPNGNRMEIKKTSTMPEMKVCVNRDIYLSPYAEAELNTILLRYMGKIINNQTIVSAESEVSMFFKNCLSVGSASFDVPAGTYFKIDREQLFEYN